MPKHERAHQRAEVVAYRLTPRLLRNVLVRFATPNSTVGALVWLTDGRGRVLLTTSSYKPGWLPVGGYLRAGEGPLDAARRELAEELGNDVGQQTRLSSPHRAAFDVSLRVATFVMVGVVPATVEVNVGPELLETRWWPLDGLPAFPPSFTEGFDATDRDALLNVTRHSDIATPARAADD